MSETKPKYGMTRREAGRRVQFKRPHWSIGEGEPENGGKGVAIVFGDDESEARKILDALNSHAPLSTENARLRDVLEEASDALVCDYMCGESPCEHKAVKSKIKALLAGQPVADPREAEMKRLHKTIMLITEMAHFGGVYNLSGEQALTEVRKLTKDRVKDRRSATAEYAPAPQPDAVRVLREACEWIVNEADNPAGSYIDGNEMGNKARAALAATEGVSK